MLGYYNPSVILTYLSLFSAALGISFAMGEGGTFPAVLCLLVSGVCDMFDGAVAGRCKRSEEEKLFGIQIDSLCDLVAFGALPAVVTLDLAGGSLLSKIAAGLLLLTSVIRLGYFNVQELVRDRDEKRTHYTGMPVTLCAIFFPLLLVIGSFVPAVSAGVWASGSMILLAALEVLRFPLRKPHGAGKIVVLVLGIAVLALVLIFRERLGA